MIIARGQCFTRLVPCNNFIGLWPLTEHPDAIYLRRDEKSVLITVLSQAHAYGKSRQPACTKPAGCRMTWLWRTLQALLAIFVLVLMLAAGGLLYSVHYIKTPPVADPARPLTSWIHAEEPRSTVAAPWEIAARQHQYDPLDIAHFISPPPALWTVDTLVVARQSGDH